MGQKIKATPFALFLLCLLVTRAAFGQSPSESFPYPYSELTLSNGLHVILSEDYSLPLVSVVVAYKTGSLFEDPEKSGLAYLIENLMFQGSANIGRMQHINYIQKTGGTLNALTSLERSLFYQTVPSNQLALILWLESDRMNSLTLSFQDVSRVKEDLIEEVVQRRLEDPYVESRGLFNQLLFPDLLYHRPLLGTEANIHAITFEDVETFYSTYYRPNNAVLCVVGNFNRARAEELIRNYFESIPEGADIPEPASPLTVEGSAETRTMESSVAVSPATHLGYRLARPYSDDYYRLVLIEYLLIHGRSSRLFKRIVKRERYAFDVTGGIEIRRDQAAFKIFVVHNNERLRDRTQDALFNEINRLKSSPVSEDELTRAKNMFKVNYFNVFSTFADRALFLCDNYIFRGGLGHLSGELDRYMSATPTSIIGVMNRYFDDDPVLVNVKIR